MVARDFQKIFLDLKLTSWSTMTSVNNYLTKYMIEVILMTIKDAAKRTGISTDNLRYYERIGLLPPIPRNKSGIREYDERAIHWIEFVMKFKKAGASLEDKIGRAHV